MQILLYFKLIINLIFNVFNFIIPSKQFFLGKSNRKSIAKFIKFIVRKIPECFGVCLLQLNLLLLNLLLKNHFLLLLRGNLLISNLNFSFIIWIIFFRNLIFFTILLIYTIIHVWTLASVGLITRSHYLLALKRRWRRFLRFLLRNPRMFHLR